MIYHVENVACSSTLDEVQLAVGVSVVGTGSRADEEGSREVVAQNGGAKSFMLALMHTVLQSVKNKHTKECSQCW